MALLPWESAERSADATSPRREISVGISPQVELGVSADENSKLDDGALHAVSTLTLRLFCLGARLPMSLPSRRTMPGAARSSRRPPASQPPCAARDLRGNIAPRLGR